MEHINDMLWDIAENASGDLEKEYKKIGKNMPDEESRQRAKDAEDAARYMKESFHDRTMPFTSEYGSDDEDYYGFDDYGDDAGTDEGEYDEDEDTYKTSDTLRTSDSREKKFRALAKAGNVEGQYELGMLYSAHTFDVPMVKEGVYWLKKAAQRRNADAMLQLGKMCDIEYLSDHTLADEWYYPAAERGKADAQYRLAKGMIADRKDKDAVTWLMKAAEQGHSAAIYELGKLYNLGYGVDKNESAAFECMKKSAELGNKDAMFLLGACYRDGHGCEKDEKKALKCIRRSAEIGSADGAIAYANMFYKGQIVKQDYGEALKWAQKAVERGGTDAYSLIIGDCYRYGYASKKDPDKAAYYYYKAIENKEDVFKFNIFGLHDLAKTNALASSYLGDAYMKMTDTESMDEKDAYNAYMNAAKNGSARGEYKVGYCFDTGCYVHQNHRTAFKWYRKACDHGSLQAKFELATMYEEGRGTFRDANKGLELLIEAADAGNADACNLLGSYYQKGKRVEKDPAKAMNYYQKGSKNGSNDAEYNIGVMYEEGLGIPKNRITAYKHYLKAAENGSSNGKNKIRGYLDAIGCARNGMEIF